MTTSAITGVNHAATGGTNDGVASAFRTADFLQVMLSELKQQDPMSPQDTSKIVENMQKLQELANTQFTKFRNDVRWAQDLMGQTVEVQQQGGLDDKAIADLASKGLNPDVGYGNVNGTISSYKVVGEMVYVTVDGHDYPIDNVKKVTPRIRDPDTLTRIADELMGRSVGYRDEDDKSRQGTVTAVGWSRDGTGIELELDGGPTTIPYASVTAITIPANANA